jgi:four helix bundle protein
VRVPKQSENESGSEHSPLFSLRFHTVSRSKNRCMFDFQNLEVYKKAKSFNSECRRLILKNNFDKYVIDQLGRASFSVPLNIAEGSGKFSKADRRNYFTTARASVFECIAALDILCDEGKLTKIELEDLMKKADELSRMLYAMIRNLS